MGQIKLSRTLKHGYNAENIKGQRDKTNVQLGGAKFSVDNPCNCTVCGVRLEILTHVHAEKHGYRDKYEMPDVCKRCQKKPNDSSRPNFLPRKK